MPQSQKKYSKKALGLSALVFSIALTKIVVVPEYCILLRHDSVAIVWLFRYRKQITQEFGKIGTGNLSSPKISKYKYRI